MEEETDVSRKRAAPFSGEDGTRTLARQPNPNPCPSVLLLYPRVTAQTWGLPLVTTQTWGLPKPGVYRFSYINSILTHRYTHDHHLAPPNQNSRCYFFRLHGPSPTRSGRLCCPARSEPHSPWYHLPPNSLDLKD